MCGIIALHGPQNDEWIINANDVMQHRGPDDNGVYRDRDSSLSLAMRRLSIIDIETGAQPMSTENGEYVIIFNGEIYNAVNLRLELEGKGIKFSTHHSDTETLLKLYQVEGKDMLNKLNGMFAFVIYNVRRKELFCARDRIGIKPFYYVNTHGRFVIASELKSILRLPFIDRDVNVRSIYHYMSLMFVPGVETCINKIFRLPAGHFLTYNFKDRNVNIRRWWKPEFSNSTGYTKRNMKDTIQEKLETAVKRWSISDVPIGCSLSGGLDSSSIVSCLTASGKQVKTYSLGFANAEEKAWNELPRARAIANKFNTEHHELILDATELLNDLPSMVWYLDEPYAGGLPSWTVFKFMSQDVKVGLTGTGGDELFGNYGKWRPSERCVFSNVLASKYSKQKFQDRFFERFYYFKEKNKRNILLNCDSENWDTPEMLWKYFEECDSNYIRDRLGYVDISTQLPEEFLMMTDRFSMAHSLEARTPFLDHEFVEFVLSIPYNYRTNRKDLKKLLKSSVSNLLPKDIINAPKMGFVIPLKLWIRNNLREIVEKMLNPERLSKQEIFDPLFYKRYVVPHVKGQADYTNKIWAAFMFQFWYFLYIENSTIESPTFSLAEFNS